MGNNKESSKKARCNCDDIGEGACPVHWEDQYRELREHADELEEVLQEIRGILQGEFGPGMFEDIVAEIIDTLDEAGMWDGEEED